MRGEAAKRETRQRKIGQVISNERGYFTARGRRTVIRTRRFSMGIIPAMIPSSPPLFFPPSSRITEFHRETGYRGSVAFNAESLPLSLPPPSVPHSFLSFSNIFNAVLIIHFVRRVVHVFVSIICSRRRWKIIDDRFYTLATPLGIITPKDSSFLYTRENRGGEKEEEGGRG